jgi:hypothetical protein
LIAERIIATRKGSWDSETLDIDAALNTIFDPKSHDFGGGVLVEMRYESLAHIALELRTALLEMDAILDAIDETLSD